MSHEKVTVSKRSRPWGARIRTIDALGSGFGNDTIFSMNSKQSGSNRKFKIHHIPSLPNSEHADAILQRVQNEFSEIALRRGYKISTGALFLQILECSRIFLVNKSE